MWVALAPAALTTHAQHAASARAELWRGVGLQVVVREPVERWERSRGGESLLGRYYGDQQANAFMFETYAMMSRCAAWHALQLAPNL